MLLIWLICFSHWIKWRFCGSVDQVWFFWSLFSWSQVADRVKRFRCKFVACMGHSKVLQLLVQTAKFTEICIGLADVLIKTESFLWLISTPWEITCPQHYPFCWKWITRMQLSFHTFTVCVCKKNHFKLQTRTHYKQTWLKFHSSLQWRWGQGAPLPPLKKVFNRYNFWGERNYILNSHVQAEPLFLFWSHKSQVAWPSVAYNVGG